MPLDFSQIILEIDQNENRGIFTFSRFGNRLDTFDADDAAKFDFKPESRQSNEYDDSPTSSRR